MPNRQNPAPAPERRRRPRDRKAQIIAAATRLFAESGYGAVGVDDIAEAVGITGPAVYRHFGGKKELLHRVILDGVDPVDVMLHEVGTKVSHDADLALDKALQRFATLAIDHRGMTLVCERDARHLADEALGNLARQQRQVQRRLSAFLRAARPELDSGTAGLLVQAVLGVFSSPSLYRLSLPRPRFARLLHELATRVCAAPISPHDGGPHPKVRPAATTLADARASTRERLLTTAPRLFAERGFHAVTMEDIGASVGIAGPSVYEHFASKADVLYATLRRGGEALHISLSRSLTQAAEPADALDKVVRSYVTFATEYIDLMSVLVTETINLPGDQQREITRIQRDYVAEWIRLLTAIHPTLTREEARVTVGAAYGAVNDVVKAKRFDARPKLHDDLVIVANALLHTPDSRSIR